MSPAKSRTSFTAILAARCLGKPYIPVLIAGKAMLLTFSWLLIIWLLQQAPIGSVGGCPDQRFPRRFASFSPTLPPRRRASSIWRLVAGQMGLFAFDAGTKDATNW